MHKLRVNPIVPTCGEPAAAADWASSCVAVDACHAMAIWFVDEAGRSCTRPSRPGLLLAASPRPPGERRMQACSSSGARRCRSRGASSHGVGQRRENGDRGKEKVICGTSQKNEQEKRENTDGRCLAFACTGCRRHPIKVTGAKGNVSSICRQFLCSH